MNSMTEYPNADKTVPFMRLTLLLCLLLMFLLASTVSAASITINWDRNQEPDIAGYIIYWGTTSRNYTNSTTLFDSTRWPLQRSYVIDDLEEGKTYYIALKAFDLAGQKSEFSVELVRNIPLDDTSQSSSDDWYANQNFMYAGQVEITDKWQTVVIPEEKQFQNPVVIVSPPTYNGIDPCIIRLRHVTSESFEIKLQEWLYLDGYHYRKETVSYLIIEEGTHILPDGTVWQAGTYSLQDTLNWQQIDYSVAFAERPLVFSSSQTYNGIEPFTVRMKMSLPEGFSAMIQEEESKCDGHTSEIIGYLAVEPTEDLNAEELGCTQDPIPLFATPYSPEIFLEEERSADPETEHSKEQVAIVVINGHVFAHIQSYNGSDPVSLRIIE